VDQRRHELRSSLFLALLVRSVRCGAGFQNRGHNHCFLAQAELWRLLVDELGPILPRRDVDSDGVRGPFRLVIPAQSLAQAMGFHPNDRVSLGVEARAASQRLHCDVVLLDRVRRAFEILLANVFQQQFKIRGTIEQARGKHRSKLIFFLRVIRGCLHFRASLIEGSIHARDRVFKPL